MKALTQWQGRVPQLLFKHQHQSTSKSSKAIESADLKSRNQELLKAAVLNYTIPLGIGCFSSTFFENSQ
ncbi:hypothetical protein Dimus_037636 [Dionaea muscipula]